jgi:hypothetical protein
MMSPGLLPSLRVDLGGIADEMRGRLWVHDKFDDDDHQRPLRGQTGRGFRGDVGDRADRGVPPREYGCRFLYGRNVLALTRLVSSMAPSSRSRTSTTTQRRRTYRTTPRTCRRFDLSWLMHAPMQDLFRRKGPVLKLEIVYAASIQRLRCQVVTHP